MNRHEPGSGISWLLGEFKDKLTEREYRQAGFFESRLVVRRVLSLLYFSLLSILVTGVALSDYAYINWFHLALHLVYSVFALLIILRIPRITSFSSLAITATVFEVITIGVWFSHIYFSGTAFYQGITNLGFVSFVLFVYLVPNRWIHTLIISFVTGLAYLLLDMAFSVEFSLNNHLSILFLLVFVFIAINISGRSYSRESRLQYINNRELTHLSFTDPLTGIANRGRFNDALHSWVRCADEYNIPLSLAIFDFDDFKAVNDSFGHLIGDQVILQTVNLVDDTIRKRDVFARWGGEEFVLLFPDTHIDEVLEIVERIRQVIEDNWFIRCGHVTASFGVSQYRIGETPDSFVDRADRMLYRAKADGKNCIRSAL